ncbi:MAG: aspartate carbamoyltransferase regulatory subunit [Cenarchaeum symbiont of Oopsacas minuta]|nr:aspartate carbamoyltransferase regulatory subunit [Cenarchaeum symbiont of Oopsacas minuta]
MSESELSVRRINDGTVIDHINDGKGLQVLSALGIDGKDGGLVTIALNVPSGKYNKKDIIKIEGKFLKNDDTNKIAIIASKATINIIRAYRLVEKRRVALPNEIGNIFRCTNPDCVTNSTESIDTIMDVVEKRGPVLKCRYCSRILDVNRLDYDQ